MFSLIQRLRDNRGFSLIELMVTVLIIGVLAAIALPAYMGHQKKGKDSDAQSNARNLTSRVELCFATQEDYRECDSETELGGNLGVPYGTDPGEVSVVTADEKIYKVTAISKAESDGSRHTFSIDHTSSGTNERLCTAGSTNTEGSCRSGKW